MVFQSGISSLQESENKHESRRKLPYVFHDRFLIIDETLTYHVGASLKDARKKCFAINRIEDRANIHDILKRTKKINSRENEPYKKDVSTSICR